MLRETRPLWGFQPFGAEFDVTCLPLPFSPLAQRLFVFSIRSNATDVWSPEANQRVSDYSSLPLRQKALCTVCEAIKLELVLFQIERY